MATPLLWKSYQLWDQIYSKLYSHIITIDFRTETLIAQRNYRKLIYFDLNSALIFLNSMAGFYVPLKLFFSINEDPVYIALIQILLGFILLMTNLYNYYTYIYGTEICSECVYHLFRFDRKLRQVKQKYGYFLDLPLKNILLTELRKILKFDRSTDFMGLIMIAIVLALASSAIVIPISVLYFQLDPFYFILRDMALLRNSFYLELTIRFLVIQCVTLECCRSCTRMALEIVSVFKIFLSCLHVLSRKAPDASAYSLYNTLHCINQMGQYAIQRNAGISMVAAFMAGTLGSFILVRGYNIFPTLIYVMLLTVVTTILASAIEALPKIVECNDFSKTLLNVIWSRKGRAYWENRLKTLVTKKQRTEYNVWKRVKKAQRPLVFYYGSAQFDKETKSNFFNLILDNAVSLILVT